jgi:hypothetical protein
VSTPLEAFGSSIDLDASKVLNFPSLIFLCGGPIETGSGIQPSLRALFYERLLKDHPELRERVLLAEEANKWSKAAKHYDDLFVLEDDLAHLSAVIMLFVESPGSIAELGSFCHVESFRKKIIAVIEHRHEGQESFIQDGPVASLKRNDPRSVLFYPWLGPPDEYGRRPLDPDTARETVDHLLTRLLDEMSQVTNEERFDSKNPGHTILLVADLVKLGVIVKYGEIETLLAAVGLNLGGRLERYLFLLEKLKLIEKTQYGHSTYYLGRGSPNRYIHYALKSKSQTPDRIRLQSSLSELLEPLDRDRRKAFQAHSKKTDGRHG